MRATSLGIFVQNYLGYATNMYLFFLMKNAYSRLAKKILSWQNPGWLLTIDPIYPMFTQCPHHPPIVPG